jgi:hypothetical protein
MFKNSTLIFIQRNISRSTAFSRRPRPKEELENTALASLKPKKGGEPYDRRWHLTSKSAEPYNVRGGSLRWTKMLKFRMFKSRLSS